MRLWRHGGALLIDRGPAREPVLGVLLRIAGRAWPEPPGDYALVDEAGGVVENYRTMTWSLDDELGAELVLVEKQALVQVSVRSIRGHDTCEQAVVLDGLEAVGPGDEAALECARVFLEREAALDEERRESGLARVAAIAGALDEHGLGDDFSAAQRALRDRIAAYGEPLCEELLRTLLCLGALHRAAPSLAPALATLVWACRRAAFDRELPRGDAPACDVARYQPPGAFAGLDARQQAEALALVAALRTLQGDLDGAADGQERADANQNAAAYSTVARAVGHARAFLKGALRAG